MVEFCKRKVSFSLSTTNKIFWCPILGFKTYALACELEIWKDSHAWWAVTNGVEAAGKETLHASLCSDPYSLATCSINGCQRGCHLPLPRPQSRKIIITETLRQLGIHPLRTVEEKKHLFLFSVHHIALNFIKSQNSFVVVHLPKLL